MGRGRRGSLKGERARRERERRIRGAARRRLGESERDRNEQAAVGRERGVGKWVGRRKWGVEGAGKAREDGEPGGGDM